MPSSNPVATEPDHGPAELWLISSFTRIGIGLGLYDQRGLVTDGTRNCHCIRTDDLDRYRVDIGPLAFLVIVSSVLGFFLSVVLRGIC